MYTNESTGYTRTKNFIGAPEEKLLKALVYSRSKQTVAKAAMKLPYVQQEASQYVTRKLKTEASALCSSKQKSYLRMTSPSDLSSISWEQIVDEWKERAKLLYEVHEFEFRKMTK